ncbi:MAG: hypothetical protein MUE36_00660 [Acidimicrobiales bacterium]|jgi:predicted amidophosphoribosyltransferase|nr:hypothetical protein [Acidimicrobiales bacterium]
MWFPQRCARCQLPGRSPCAVCARELRPAPRLDLPEGLDSLAALVAYDDRSRPLVVAVKYRNARSSLATLAPALAAMLPVLGPDAAVTWAPTTAARRRQRGFDQAELLARAVGRSGGRSGGTRALLRRLDGPSQTGRSAPDRRVGPAFTAVDEVPDEVVVVDDVCTTGATLAAAAVALRDAGARVVHGAVLARTPPRAVAA